MKGHRILILYFKYFEVVRKCIKQIVLVAGASFSAAFATDPGIFSFFLLVLSLEAPFYD